MSFYYPTANDLAELEARAVVSESGYDWRNSAWCEDSEDEPQTYYAPSLPESPLLQPHFFSNWDSEDEESSSLDMYPYAQWRSDLRSDSVPDLRAHSCYIRPRTSSSRSSSTSRPTSRHMRNVEPLYLPASCSPVPPSPPHTPSSFLPRPSTRRSWHNRRQAVYMKTPDPIVDTFAKATSNPSSTPAYLNAPEAYTTRTPSPLSQCINNESPSHSRMGSLTPVQALLMSEEEFRPRPPVRLSNASMASTAGTPSLSQCSSSESSTGSFLHMDNEDVMSDMTHASTHSLPAPHTSGRKRRSATPARWSFTPARSAPATPTPKRASSTQVAPPTAYHEPARPRLRKQSSGKLVKAARPQPARIVTSHLSPSMPSPSAQSIFPSDPFGRPGALSPPPASTTPSAASVEAAAAAWVPEWVGADGTTANAPTPQPIVPEMAPRVSRRKRVTKLFFGWASHSSVAAGV